MIFFTSRIKIFRINLYKKYKILQKLSQTFPKSFPIVFVKFYKKNLSFNFFNTINANRFGNKY